MHSSFGLLIQRRMNTCQPRIKSRLAFYLKSVLDHQVLELTRIVFFFRKFAMKTTNFNSKEEKIAPNSLDGVVTRKITNSYTVTTGGLEYECTPASHLRLESRAERGDQIALGDLVRIRPLSAASAQILEVLPRRNKLSRRSAVPMPGAVPFEQLIAANIDQVVPVFAAANPSPKWGMLDRYLALAEAQDLTALIVITKIDLAVDGTGNLDQELTAAVAEFRRIGYPVLLTSALTGMGIAELGSALKGKISVLLGKSGVGKSALLNALEPGLGQRVGAVSQMTGKGKHTTTHLQMFPLAVGGNLIDTPGVREFGLYDVDERDVAFLYREIAPLLGQCRFGLGCGHSEEPGCVVRQAVMDGQISARRYHSYLSLVKELG